MAVYIGGKKVQETGGKYQPKGIPQRSSNRPHHTKRERVGSRETGFTFRDTPITGGKPAHTPAEQFENLRLRKNELQHIPYSGDDSGRNMYQMGIQNLLGRGDKHKQAYLQKYPIGGRINLGVPAAFNALGSNIIPGLSTISRMFGDKLSGAKTGLQSMFAGPMKDLGFEKNKFMQDLSKAPSGFWNNLQTMLGGNKSQNLPEIKSTATQEDIISPAALSRLGDKKTYGVGTGADTGIQGTGDYLKVEESGPGDASFPIPRDTELWDIPSEYDYGFKLASGETPSYGPYRFPMHEMVAEGEELSFPILDEFGNYLMQNPNLGPHATNMADGGDIQSDAYARLKAINDSMHEM